MTRPLGRHQLQRLAVLASPGRAYIVNDKVLRSLTRRGLTAEAEPDAFIHITPEGLRALAGAAEQGRIRLAPDLPDGHAELILHSKGDRA